MGYSAVVSVFNKRIVQVRGDRVAIGFPNKDEAVFLQFGGDATANDAATILRDWLRAHLRAGGVEFENDME